MVQLAVVKKHEVLLELGAGRFFGYVHSSF
jgi:hypothetical protein